jgi:hypothetical protein
MNEFFYDFPLKYRLFQQSAYTILEYTTFTYIVYLNIFSEKVRKAIFLLSACFIIFVALFYYFAYKLGRIDSVAIGIESILIFLYCFFYFRDTLKRVNNSFFGSSTLLLIIGVLLYLGTSFFINLLANNITKAQIDKYWHYTYIPEIVKNILFAIAILKYKIASSKNEAYDKSKTPYLDML